MDINYYKQYEPIFGAWRITRLIGEGSFGKVFEMEREDFGVTYKAALKAITVPANESEVREVMAEGMDEASVRDYFGTFVQDLVKEFALMSKLKGNSNVVSYENHQVIEHKGGIGWDILIQMELLTPLNEYTRKHTITRQDVIRLGIDLCRALELCQKYNIIHRDVKPENIFISDAGDFKLGDFGIARTVEKTTSGLSKKGTYTYMAPEVYKGEAYGSTVDIYSLGIVLYRLLNGNRTPFLPAAPAPITHADRENALVKRLSGAALPPPSHAEGRLSEIVLKACAYDPKERYSSPMQMRHELEAILYSREEGKYIYPEGDDVPQDSVHYVKTGEEGLGAGYERTQRDGDGTAGRFAGSGTTSDFGGSRTTSDFDGSRTASDFGGSRTASDFGGSRSGGRFDGTRTVSDFTRREPKEGPSGGNPPPEPGVRREQKPQTQPEPQRKKGIGKILAAAGAACAALAIVLALVLGGGNEEPASGREQMKLADEGGNQEEALSGTGDSQEEGVFPGDTIYIGVYDIPDMREIPADPEQQEQQRSYYGDYLIIRWLLDDFAVENNLVEIGGKEYQLELVFASQMEGSYPVGYEINYESGEYAAGLYDMDYPTDAAALFAEHNCLAVIAIYDSYVNELAQMLADLGIPVIENGMDFMTGEPVIDENVFYTTNRDVSRAEYQAYLGAMWQFAQEELGASSVLYLWDNPNITDFYQARMMQAEELGFALESFQYEGVDSLTEKLLEGERWDIIFADTGDLRDGVDVALEQAGLTVPVLTFQNFADDLTMDLYAFDVPWDRTKEEVWQSMVEEIQEREHFYLGGARELCSALDAYQVLLAALPNCSQPADLAEAIRGVSVDGFMGNFHFDENGQAVYSTISYWHDGEWKNYEFR